MALSKENEKYFENLFDMINTPGWADMMKQLKEERAQVAEAMLTRPLSVEEYHFGRGIITKLDFFLGLKEHSELVYEQAKEEDEAA